MVAQYEKGSLKVKKWGKTYAISWGFLGLSYEKSGTFGIDGLSNYPRTRMECDGLRKRSCCPFQSFNPRTRMECDIPCIL